MTLCTRFGKRCATRAATIDPQDPPTRYTFLTPKRSWIFWMTAAASSTCWSMLRGAVRSGWNLHDFPADR
eukprot:3716702-Rhodomonas_salina.3